MSELKRICVYLLYCFILLPLWLQMTEQWMFFMYEERYSFSLCYVCFNLWIMMMIYVGYDFIHTT